MSKSNGTGNGHSGGSVGERVEEMLSLFIGEQRRANQETHTKLEEVLVKQDKLFWAIKALSKGDLGEAEMRVEQAAEVFDPIQFAALKKKKKGGSSGRGAAGR